MNTTLSIYDMPSEIIYNIICKLPDRDMCSFLLSCKYIRNCVDGSTLDIHCVNSSRLSLTVNSINNKVDIEMQMCEAHIRYYNTRDMMCMYRCICIHIDSIHGKIRDIQFGEDICIMYCRIYASYLVILNNIYSDMTYYASIIRSTMDYVCESVERLYFSDMCSNDNMRKRLHTCIRGTCVLELRKLHFTKILADVKDYSDNIYMIGYIYYIIIKDRIDFNINLSIPMLHDYVKNSYPIPSKLSAVYILGTLMLTPQALNSFHMVYPSGVYWKIQDILYTNKMLCMLMMFKVCIECRIESRMYNMLFCKLVEFISYQFADGITDDNFGDSMFHMIEGAIRRISKEVEICSTIRYRFTWKEVHIGMALLFMNIMDPSVTSITVSHRYMIKHIRDAYILCKTVHNSYVGGSHKALQILANSDQNLTSSNWTSLYNIICYIMSIE